MKPGYKHDPKEFTDVSDYARPLAIWIANILKNTKVKVYQITLFHFGLTVLAVYQIQTGQYVNIVLGCILLLAKNVVDAVDGSVARIRNHPSKVGRFLDSNLDFIGNLMIFAVLPINSLPLKVIAFLSFILQSSLYNYWSIRHQKKYNHKFTSDIKETPESKFPYDNKNVLIQLFRIYQLFYGWQDWIMRKLFNKKTLLLSNNKMTLLSFNGLGLQQVIIILGLITGKADWIAYWFIFMTIPSLLITNAKKSV